MSYSNGKFHALIEEDGKLRPILSSRISVSARQVSEVWFKKFIKVETEGRGIGQHGWVDHIGKLKDQEVFVSAALSRHLR